MLKKLTDRIYYLEGQEKTDRPFIFYVKGDREALAVDAGESANHVAVFYRELKRAGLPLPDHTVITHWHWDHTFGMHAVHGITYATDRTNRKLREQMCMEWTEEALDDRVAGGGEIFACAYGMKEEYAFLSDIIIKEADVEVMEEMTIDLGGIECRLIPHDSTHSRDALFVHIPTENAIAVGDGDYEDYYDNDYRYDQQKLADYISFMESLDFEYCLRGHAGVMTRQEIMDLLGSKVGSDEQSNLAPAKFKELLGIG